MGITQGQVKPYNSIPRIDWSNPDTAGLTTYCYDTGRSIIDLVNGSEITTVGVLASQSSPFGSGMKFPLNGYGYMPPLPLGKAAKFGGVAPYSAAMGTLFLGTTGPSSPDSACVSVQDAGNSQDTGFGFNTWPPTDPITPNAVSCVFGNVDNAFFNGQKINPGTFQSWAVAVTSSTSAQLYANGVPDRLFSSTTTFNLAQPQIMFNTARSDTQSFGNGINGFASYYAMWDRAIPAAVPLRIHQNPWSILIYPEDEFATIGLTAGYLLTVSYKVLGINKQVVLGISPNEFPDQATAIQDTVSKVSAYRAARGETITNVAAVVSQVR